MGNGQFLSLFHRRICNNRQATIKKSHTIDAFNFNHIYLSVPFYCPLLSSSKTFFCKYIYISTFYFLLFYWLECPDSSEDEQISDSCQAFVQNQATIHCDIWLNYHSQTEEAVSRVGRNVWVHLSPMQSSWYSG